MICFYHSADLDGHCSGAIVKRRYPDCEMIGINYGDEFPWDKVYSRNVIMVDFCLQPFSEHMPKLAKVCNLTWIDHHKTEIEGYYKWLSDGNLTKSISGARAESYDKAACELAWDYYFDEVMPLAVRLLGRYDVWDLTYSADVMPFQWGMRVNKDTYPEAGIWEILLDQPVGDITCSEIITTGKTILGYRDSENAKYVKSFSFESEFEGLNFICINRGMTNSQMFDSIWDESKYDGMLTFAWKKGQWTLSMYTTKGIDLSLIAKKHGGGGHEKACGFQCDTAFLLANILGK
jgi:hypothetical protein